MKPPIEPNKEDCCDSGCNPCIFDVYEKQVRLYKLFIESGERSNTSAENAMSQLKYKQFNVINNIDICKQHRLLLLRQNDPEPGKHVFWSPGEHFLVRYQSEQGTCSRAYTPIKLDHLCEDFDFAIIVKRYNSGIVSNYLCDMSIGESSFWRGPYGDYNVNSNKFCRLIMIAQGTGITPIFSIIKHILLDEESMTKIILLFCCKCVDSILLRDELYSLNSYWNFEYAIYVTDNSDNTILKYKEPISFGRLTANNVIDLKPSSEKDQFLLCGSEEFMMHYSKIAQEIVPSVSIVKF